MFDSISHQPQMPRQPQIPANSTIVNVNNDSGNYDENSSLLGNQINIDEWFKREVLWQAEGVEANRKLSIVATILGFINAPAIFNAASQGALGIGHNPATAGFFAFSAAVTQSAIFSYGAYLALSKVFKSESSNDIALLNKNPITAHTKNGFAVLGKLLLGGVGGVGAYLLNLATLFPSIGSGAHVCATLSFVTVSFTAMYGVHNYVGFLKDMAFSANRKCKNPDTRPKIIINFLEDYKKILEVIPDADVSSIKSKQNLSEFLKLKNSYNAYSASNIQKGFGGIFQFFGGSMGLLYGTMFLDLSNRVINLYNQSHLGIGVGGIGNAISGATVVLASLINCYACANLGKMVAEFPRNIYYKVLTILSKPNKTFCDYAGFSCLGFDKIVIGFSVAVSISYAIFMFNLSINNFGTNNAALIQFQNAFNFLGCVGSGMWGFGNLYSLFKEGTSNCCVRNECFQMSERSKLMEACNKIIDLIPQLDEVNLATIYGYVQQNDLTYQASL
jgi:hypothetical protein